MTQFDPNNPEHVRVVEEEKARICRYRNPKMLWYLTDQELWEAAQKR